VKETMIRGILNRLKGFARKLKMRLFPPSSRSFHGAVRELASRMDALENGINNLSLNKALVQDNHNIDLLLNRAKYSEAMSYVLLHQGMEQRLREKVRRGGKVKVLFFMQYKAKFECQSVYCAMEAHELFEPYVLITHPRDKMFVQEPVYLEEAKNSYRIMRERGYRTIFGYDDLLRPISLERLAPDIIFWNNPNMFHFSHYQNLYLNANYLTCYTSYFFNTLSLRDKKRFLYSLEHFQIMTTWKIFVESYPAFYSAIEKFQGWEVRIATDRPQNWVGVNAVLSGYPKLDPYKNGHHTVLPDKISNGKPIVIYAPHWSIRTDTYLATFHLFNQQFLELVRRHPEINFVFKPHPDLHNRFIDLKKAGQTFTLSPEEYDAYVNEWDSLPNGMLIDDGEYIDLFKASSCLITDCGSFIAEYLPSGHPCIYLLNPEKKNPLDIYSEFGRKVVESYYCCNNWEEIERYFNSVVLEGKDPNRELRAQIAAESYLNIGTAGQFICDYIAGLLTDEVEA